MMEELSDAALIDYIEKRVPEQECQKIEQHLVECNTCRDRFRQISSIAQGLEEIMQSPSRNDIPFELDVEILSDVKTTLRRKERGLRNLFTVIAAASVIALVTWFTVQYLQPRQDKENKSIVDKSPLVKPNPGEEAAESGKIKPNVIAGDINLDGKVDIIDAQLLQKCLVAEKTMDVLLGDVTGDGIVDIRDVQNIVRNILKDSK